MFCFCGKPLKKNANKYCSIKCQHIHQNKIRITKYLSGELSGSDSYGLVRDFVRNYLYELRGEKCEICGWNEVNQTTGKSPLHIHHIDGNSSNSLPNNLKILCPNHHALTDNYGNANKGNGRKNRYK